MSETASDPDEEMTPPTDGVDGVASPDAPDPEPQPELRPPGGFLANPKIAVRVSKREYPVASEEELE